VSHAAERTVRGLPYAEYRRLWAAGQLPGGVRRNPERRCPRCGKPSGRAKNRHGYGCRPACAPTISPAERRRKAQLAVTRLIRGGVWQ